MTENPGNSLLTPLMVFLERQPGLPFCTLCLAHTTDLRVEDVRQALGALTPPRFTCERRRCVRCFRDDVVVYARG